MRRLTAVALVALLVTSCSSAGSSVPPSRPTRGSPDVLTREDLASTSASNALLAVQQLRPAWLRTRGDFTASRSSRAADVVVYLDGTRLGTWRDLAQISPTDVKELRFYSASDATTRWGTGHTSGAITVTTR